MKTPEEVIRAAITKAVEEVIDHEAEWRFGETKPQFGQAVLVALEAAGYVIVEKAEGARLADDIPIWQKQMDDVASAERQRQIWEQSGEVRMRERAAKFAEARDFGGDTIEALSRTVAEGIADGIRDLPLTEGKADD